VFPRVTVWVAGLIQTFPASVTDVVVVVLSVLVVVVVLFIEVVVVEAQHAIIMFTPVPDGVPIRIPFKSARLSTVRAIIAEPPADPDAVRVILTRLKSVLPGIPFVLKPASFIVPAVRELTVKLRPDAISAVLTNDTRLAGYVTVNPNAPKLLEPVLT
jgi:hypothetical protein